MSKFSENESLAGSRIGSLSAKSWAEAIASGKVFISIPPKWMEEELRRFPPSATQYFVDCYSAKRRGLPAPLPSSYRSPLSSPSAPQNAENPDSSPGEQDQTEVK